MAYDELTDEFSYKLGYAICGGVISHYLHNDTVHKVLFRDSNQSINREMINQWKLATFEDKLLQTDPYDNDELTSNFNISRIRWVKADTTTLVNDNNWYIEKILEYRL